MHLGRLSALMPRMPITRNDRHPLRRSACLMIGSIGLLVALSACSPSLFPPKAMQGLDPTFQMSIFSPESDVYFKGRVGQVGGRIISASPTTQGLLITAQGLPLKDLVS